MKKYELLLVLPGTLDENEAEVKLQEILALVKENSAEAEPQNLGKSRLAYPVKQIRYGYFYTIVFTAETEGLKIIQNKISLMRDLLRGMITHYNTSLTANQKIAYSTDSLGITTMAPSEDKKFEVEMPIEKVVEKADKVADKVAEKVDLAEIDKKLDEILDGSVIPGL